MFQMINEEKPTAEDRKMLWVKVAMFIVGVGAVGGFVYLLTVSSYFK